MSNDFKLLKLLQNMKTWWCTKCNRFAIAPTKTFIPSCPIHGNTMVDRPDDPRRIEPYSPDSDRHSRKPKFSRYLDDTKRDLIIERTAFLENLFSVNPIPVISNIEDSDLHHEVTSGMMLRGMSNAISIPGPRYVYQNKLDPNWLEKFIPALRNCDFAILARRKGTEPNPATLQEIQILQSFGKQIYVYEKYTSVM